MTGIVKIVIGLILMIIGIEARISWLRFDIISDIIGSILVIIGLNEIIEWSPLLKRSRKHAIIGVVAHVLMYIAGFYEIAKLIELLMLAITIITFIYMTYYLMEGILVKAKTEKKNEISGTIRGGWIILAIATGLYGFASISDFRSLLDGFQLAGLEYMILWFLNVAVTFSGLYFVVLLYQVKLLLYPKEEKK